MDCNSISPLPWDWENFIIFNTSQTETHIKQLPTDWEMQKGEGIESLIPFFSGFDGGGGDSVFNIWHTALSKSLQSTSENSSPHDVKKSKFTSDNHEGILGDLSSNIELSQTKASPTFEASVGFSEPLVGLNLGKRTSFHDEASTVSMNLAPSANPKKSKSTGNAIQSPWCQVEGCNHDLSSAKDYHRKHRVCEIHSKCPKVIVGGMERRFCQQCSRFHGISEFDEKKRSCRKRLSHHNARRRKPQPSVFPLKPPRIYDGRPHSSLVWNRLSLNTEAEQTFAWDDTCSTKSRQTHGFTISFSKAKGIDEGQFPDSSLLPHSITEDHNDSELFPGQAKLICFQAPNKGVEKLPGSSGLDETRGSRRALSLLSKASWDSCELKHVSLDHHTGNPPVQLPSSESFSHPFHMITALGSETDIR